MIDPRNLNSYQGTPEPERPFIWMHIRMNIKETFTRLLNRLFGGNIFPLDDRDRLVLMKEFKRRLIPVSICLLIVYFILSFLHPFAIKNNQTAIWLSWTSFVSTLCFGVLTLTSKRIRPAPAPTFLVGFGIALVLCTNSGLHLYLTREAIQSTNFMLVILGLAFAVTVWSHYLSFLVLTWVIWAAAGPLAFDDPNWFHFVIMLSMGTMVSTLTFHMSTHKLVSDARTEHTLAVAKELAESANRAKSHFLSRVSHELRTPLNSIIGFSSILELEDLHAEHRSHIGLIRKSGEHLLKLINEVLDLSNIDIGEMSISKEQVQIVSLVEEISGMIQPIAQKHRVSIRSSFRCSDHQEVVGDQRRISQICFNLATNGIKYNKEGGTLEISISDEVEGTVRINFTDTGIGIPANKMHRLFIPFDRLDIEQSTLNIEGTGLGLALCEKLATEMGGTIEAKSEEGQGSTFTVTLKACPAPELAT